MEGGCVAPREVAHYTYGLDTEVETTDSYGRRKCPTYFNNIPLDTRLDRMAAPDGFKVVGSGSNERSRPHFLDNVNYGSLDSGIELRLAAG